MPFPPDAPANNTGTDQACRLYQATISTCQGRKLILLQQQQQTWRPSSSSCSPAACSRTVTSRQLSTRSTLTLMMHLKRPCLQQTGAADSHPSRRRSRSSSSSTGASSRHHTPQQAWGRTQANSRSRHTRSRCGNNTKAHSLRSSLRSSSSSSRLPWLLLPVWQQQLQQHRKRMGKTVQMMTQMTHGTRLMQVQHQHQPLRQCRPRPSRQGSCCRCRRASGTCRRRLAATQHSAARRSSPHQHPASSSRLQWQRLCSPPLLLLRRLRAPVVCPLGL